MNPTPESVLTDLYLRTVDEHGRIADHHTARDRRVNAGKLSILAEALTVLGYPVPVSPVVVHKVKRERKPPSIPAWLRPHAHRLGIDPDNVIANDTGYCRESVRLVRERMGIGAAPADARSQKKKRVSDIDRIRDRLGVVSDYVLAAEVGRPHQWVTNVRHQLGIPCANDRRRTAGSRLSDIHHLVGTMPDAKIAAMAGVSVPYVYTYRLRHSIPSYHSQKESRA